MIKSAFAKRCMMILLVPSLSGCWGGGAWILQGFSLMTGGGRVTTKQKLEHQALMGNVVKKYEKENERRAKLGLPLLEIPEDVQQEKHPMSF